MSKRRRGMSLEEKRQVMLEILQESKTPFLLKELEKIGGKRGVGMYGFVLKHVGLDQIVVRYEKKT